MSKPKRTTTTAKKTRKPRPAADANGRASHRGEYDLLPPALKAESQSRRLANRLGQAVTRLGKWVDDDEKNIASAVKHLDTARAKLLEAADLFQAAGPEYRSGTIGEPRPKIEEGTVVELKPEFVENYVQLGYSKKDLASLTIQSRAGKTFRATTASGSDILLPRRYFSPTAAA